MKTNTYIYDKNGNRFTKQKVLTGQVSTQQQTSYVYDFENRLKQLQYVNIPGITGTQKDNFTYSGVGQRTQAVMNNVTTGYLYDGFNVLVERNGTGITTKSYTRGLDFGGGIGSLIAQNTTGTTATVRYYYYNDLGSPANLTTSTGTIASSYSYDAFGNLLTTPAASDTNRYLFSTKELDSRSGLYYFGERYYDPEVGRWLTPDPLGFVDGLNLYTYVNNNPVNMVDPYGLDEVSLGLPGSMGLPLGAGCVGGERASITQQDLDEAKKEGYDVYWKYYQVDPMGNPITNPEGPWLTGKNQITPPYGQNYTLAQNQLQLPNEYGPPNEVGPVFVSQSETVAGPRLARDNPQYGTGGGTEYYRGKSYFPTTREFFFLCVVLYNYFLL
jgi:RHS repeat-associated protein